jgi:tripartite-type tricarboxylate transporter receptor subunit TctC
MKAKHYVAGMVAAVGLAITSVQAETNYPNKPVRLVVPFAPGGATDMVGRALGQRLSVKWGQQVIVENRAGAGGNIGADIVAKSAADGYTILLASPAEITINPHLYPKMPFNPATDFTPVAKVATAPLVLVVHPSIKAQNVKSLIAEAKAAPGKLNYASSGSGGPQHLAAEQFKMAAGIDMLHVPYKGGAPAIADLLGGQVQVFFAGVPPALPHIKAGKIRALAATSAKRSALLPDVPTVRESGGPEFVVENWQGIFVPAATPKEIVTKLHSDISEITAQREFADNLLAQGAEATGGSQQDFRTFVEGESRKYADLVRQSGAKLD